jgi:DNA-binding FrmR family transcriptional regulator
MHGYAKDKEDYLVRLRRIEGQVRGLQRMVDEDAYCIEILTQISSVTRALQKVGLGLLDQHMETCVRTAVEEGGPEGSEKIAEAMAAVERLVKS